MLPIDVGRIVQGVFLGQATATVVFVRFAMNVISSGFRHEVQETSGGAAEFGGESDGDDLELLHGLDRHGKVLGFQRAEIFSEKIVRGVGAVDNQAGVV